MASEGDLGFKVIGLERRPFIFSGDATAVQPVACDGGPVGDGPLFKLWSGTWVEFSRLEELHRSESGAY